MAEGNIGDGAKSGSEGQGQSPGGLFGRLFPAKKKSARMKLGDKLAMYYNEELKCWLLPGEEDERRRQLEEEKKHAAPPILGMSAASSSASLTSKAESTAGRPGPRLGVSGRYASAGVFGAAPAASGSSGSVGLAGLRPAGSAFGGASSGAGAPAMFRPPSAVFTPAPVAEEEVAESPAAAAGASWADGSRPGSKGTTPTAAASAHAQPGGLQQQSRPASSVDAPSAAAGTQQPRAAARTDSLDVGAFEATWQQQGQYSSGDGAQYSESFTATAGQHPTAEGGAVAYTGAQYTADVLGADGTAMQVEATAYTENTLLAAGGPVHAQPQAFHADSSAQHHNSFVEPHPSEQLDSSADAMSLSGTGAGVDGSTAALLHDPVVREVLTFWSYYRGCGYEREAMAQWVAQNYPPSYADHDYDTLLLQPAVAAAAAEHLAASRAATPTATSRAATPTFGEAQQAGLEASDGALEGDDSEMVQAPIQEATLSGEAQPAPLASEAASYEEWAPAEPAEPVHPPFPQADAAPAAGTSAAASPRSHSPTRLHRAPSDGSLPPSPKERPLSAAAAELAAVAAAEGAFTVPTEAGDPTLGQVFASYLRPQFQQVTQQLKAAAGAAAAAAHQQLSVAQQQLQQRGGMAAMPVAAGDAAAAVAGGLLEAVGGGRKRKAGKLQKQLPWDQNHEAGSDAEDAGSAIPAVLAGEAAEEHATEAAEMADRKSVV